MKRIPLLFAILMAFAAFCPVARSAEVYSNINYDASCNKTRYYQARTLCIDTSTNTIYRGTGTGIQAVGSSSGTDLSITTTGLTAGQVYYPDASGNFQVADASTSTTLPRAAVGFAVSTTSLMKAGTYTTTGLTVGPYYLAVGGGITSTMPSTSGNQIQIIGIARSATKLEVNINPVVIEVK